MVAPLLIGLDGKEKMSKSLGNYVALTDSADEMFGKIMSIPDSLIVHYYEFALHAGESLREEVKGRLTKENPRDIKLSLAQAITLRYHGEKGAERAV